MVYCGKPSKGCLRCRTKRTRCDGGTPSCSQCLRAGSICSGYRDLDSLTFRDQTERFTRGHVNPHVESPGETLKSIPATLSVPVEDQAIPTFFYDYVLQDETLPNSFGYLPDVLRNERPGTALMHAVTSLGMAGIATKYKSSAVLATGDAEYAMALRLLNVALSDQQQARTDSTLITVILLGLYETSTCRTPQSLASWTKHVNGATALLRLRGKTQLNTKIGRRLFSQARLQIFSGCIHRRAPMPDIIGEYLESEAAFDRDEDAIGNRFARIASRFCRPWAELAVPDSKHDYRSLVSELRSIDTDLANLASSCPQPFHYTITPVREKSSSVIFFSNHHHIYNGSWFPTFWNNYRTIRIFVNRALVHVLRQLATDPTCPPAQLTIYKDKISDCQTIMKHLSREICDSVPLYFGDLVALNGSIPYARASAGSLLLWPLWAAASSGACSDEMRTWIVGILHKLADVTGVRQAMVLANILSGTGMVAAKPSGP